MTDETSQRLRLLIDSIKDYAILMLDREGFVLTWNKAAESIKGYRPEEIIGEHFSRFFSAADRERAFPDSLLRRAVADGRVETEGWRVRKDGTRFWADAVITTMRGDRGEVVGFTKVTRDLTERRAHDEMLRRSEERLRLMVDSVRDYAIFMLDSTGAIETWNSGAERIKGYRASEIIGRHFSTFYPEADIRSGKPALELEIAARDGRFEEEGWRLRKDGTTFWANVIITALRDGTGALVGFAKVTRDLTDRRRLEDERLRSTQAQEAIRLRDEFLSLASHELKTPLTALQLQLEAVHSRIVPIDEKLASRVDRASSAAKRLADLIENLLDVSRIATGQYELDREPFDLVATASETIDRLHDAAVASGCEIHLAPADPLVGRWDRLRIEQILMNLLANAIKYAAGKPIHVRIDREGEEAVVRVGDGGPGIADADLVRIFGRFQRATSLRHHGGMGLGLYVAKQITEAHGGTIEAMNLPGGGACFMVRLPLSGFGADGPGPESAP